MIDFFGPGWDAAEQLGVLGELRARAADVNRISYIDRRGRRTATMNYGAISRMVDGKLISVMRPDIEDVLRRSVEADVGLRWGSAITAVHNGASSVTVELSSGERISGDLLIGADGIHSTVRRLVFGPEQDFLRPLGFHTCAWLFDDPEIRAAVGDRWLMTDTVDAEVGFYGLEGDRVAAFGVHRTDDPGLPADPPGEVRSVYPPLGWMVPRAVAGMSDPADLYYDVVAQVEVPRWYDRRVVLLGDACQAVSLIAGQGASLAVAGARLLSELLIEADVDRAVETYQRRWRPLVAEKQRVGRNGTRWFLPSNRGTIWLRRLMMNGSGLPIVARLMTQGLLGKAGTGAADAGRAKTSA